MRKQTRKLIILLAIAAVLSGCVSITQPVAMGEGRYMITLNARGGFTSDGELLSRTITRANEFCRAEDKEAEILESDNSGVQMWTPQNNQVVFRCNEEPKT